MVREELARGLDPRWRRHLKGGATLEQTGNELRFVTQNATSRDYTDAQIDDYQGRPRRAFPWHPPLTLTVEARFSHPCDGLRGTAGFGFWNDPFMMTGRRLPALPRAIWFFYASSPSNMKLDLRAPGFGWKAATLDALRTRVIPLLPMAPLAIALMNIRLLYRAVWPLAQRLIGVSEAPLALEMTDWHTYTIDWGVRRARFLVDGQAVLDCNTPPQGPLGFVMWLDNQYAIVTPWGRFGYGLLDVPGRQWLEMRTLVIEPEHV
jgi:hypothetical protein